MSDEIDDIFSRAREIVDLDDRAAYLEDACRSAPDLRARVEAMLADEEGAEAWFGDTFPEGALPTALAIQSAAPGQGAERPGQMIGRYQLLEKLGEGGFGSVWMAEQTEPVTRRVALKIIKQGMDTREVIARFEAERQALALMDHPNIAKVFDAGATDSGRPYFVMELVRGMPVTGFCNDRKLDPRERLGLFQDICSAVNHAHQKGIIHRDLKPSNVLVSMQAEKPVAKVIDFGIAKATEGKLTENSLHTRFDQFVGTPAYMSPEQAERSGFDIDTRSDIYSLGVLLYELLTGTPPFDTRSLLSAGYDEMRRIIREETPLKPSSRISSLEAQDRDLLRNHYRVEPGKLFRVVRGDLDWIVMKAIEKDRSRRYETANALAADIGRYLAAEPVYAAKPGIGYRFTKFARRNKVAFAVGITIALSLLTATAVSLWQTRLARISAREALEAKRQSNARALAEQAAREESETINRFLIDAFQSPDFERDGYTITVAETLRKAAEHLERDFRNQPGLLANFRVTLGTTYAGLGLPLEAVPLLEAARDYYQSTEGAESDTILRIHTTLAGCYRNTERVDEAVALQQEVLRIRRNSAGPSHLDTARAMHELAKCHAAANHAEEALELGEASLKLFVEELGPEDPETLEAMSTMARFYEAAGRGDENRERSEEVLRRLREVLGENDPKTATAMYRLARTLIDAERFPEALELLEAAFETFRQTLGLKHASTLMARDAIAECLEHAGRWEESQKLREELLPVIREVFGEENSRAIKQQQALASSYRETGNSAGAVRLDREVVAQLREARGDEHPDTVEAMGNLALSLQASGMFDEAVTLQERVLAFRRKRFGTGDRETYLPLLHLAECHRAAGHPDATRELQDELRELIRGARPRNERATLGVMTRLAISLNLAGRMSEAIELQQEALSLMKESLAPNDLFLVRARHHLAFCYDATGRTDEARALKEEILESFRNFPNLCRLAPIDIVNDLKRDYVARKQTGKALPLLVASSARDPADTATALLVGTLQLWFDDVPGYQATYEHMLEVAESSGRHEDAERAAKLTALRPIAEEGTRKRALALTRRVIADRASENRHFYALTHGMVQYRCGLFAEAEQSLRTLEETEAGFWHEDVVRSTAAAYRTLCLFKLGRIAEARERFSTLRAGIQDPPELADFDTETHATDALVLWLACGEAATMLEVAAPDRRDPGPAQAESLAERYLAQGRTEEAVSLLATSALDSPEDPLGALLAAALQVWFGDEDGYRRTLRHMLAWGTGATRAEDAERVAKIACLRPIADAPMKAAALAMAERSAALVTEGHGQTWFLLTLGMAHFRNANYVVAESLFNLARKGDPNGYEFGMARDTAEFYLAMTQFHRGKGEQARKQFAATRAAMKPLPADEANPLSGGARHDEMVLWLACREAAALLDVPLHPAP